VAENGGPGGLFSAPFPPEPNPQSGRFNHFLGSSAPSAQRASSAPLLTFFDIHSHSTSPFPPFFRGAYFGSTSSVPKMDLSPSTLRIMARGIYRTVLPTGLRPRLPIDCRPLSSGVYSLFSGTQASSHELTTVVALSCPSSSILDRTRVP